MTNPQPNRFRVPAVDDVSPNEAHSIRSPGVNQPKCGCNCGCSCCQNDGDNEAESSPTMPTPIRGRSLTPKHDRTNGAGNPIEARPSPGGVNPPSYNSTSSVNGQEGLSLHQFERSSPIAVDVQDTHASDSIQRWLAEYHIPENHHRFSTSPGLSMRVEASTAAPSSASSGFLPPRTATSDDLTTFTCGEVDEQKAQTCAFTPLWLTHELRYCRNFQRGDVAGNDSRYPVTIELDDFLE